MKDIKDIKEIKEEPTKKRYALRFILEPTLSADEAHNYSQEINKKIEAIDGKIESAICGEQTRNLAYPIKKTVRGFLCESVFLIEPQGARALQDNLKHEARVIRYMIEAKQPVKASALRMAKERRRPMMRIETQPAKQTEKIAQDSERERNVRDKISIEEIDKKLDEIIKNI